MIRKSVVLCALALLVACDKKEPAPTAPSETPPAAPAPVAAAPAAPAEVDVSSLPVEEQYEADAEKEITAENLTTKLDDLEKEISAP